MAIRGWGLGGQNGRWRHGLALGYCRAILADRVRLQDRPKKISYRSIASLLALSSLALVSSCDESDSERMLLQYSAFGGKLFAVTLNRPVQTQLRPPGSSVFVGTVGSSISVEIRSADSLSDVSIADDERLLVVERLLRPTTKFRLLEIHLQDESASCEVLITSSEAITSPIMILGERHDRILYFSGPYISESQGTPLFNMKLMELLKMAQRPMYGPELGLPGKLTSLTEDTFLVAAYPSSGIPATNANDAIQKFRFGPGIYSVHLQDEKYTAELLSSPVGVGSGIIGARSDYVVAGLAAEPSDSTIVVQHFDPSKRVKSNIGTELSYFDGETAMLVGNVRLPDGIRFGEPVFVTDGDGKPVVRLTGVPNEALYDPNSFFVYEVNRTLDVTRQEFEIGSPPILDTASCGGP